MTNCNYFIFSAGSRYWQGGTFEVIKATSLPGESTDNKSSLEVVVPSDLEGVAYIQVEIKSVPGEWKL